MNHSFFKAVILTSDEDQKILTYNKASRLETSLFTRNARQATKKKETN